MWSALDEIISQEGVTHLEIFENVRRLKKAEVGFTAALRSFLLSYYIKKVAVEK
jgi:hypothetical protein